MPFEPMSWQAVLALIWRYHLNTLPEYPSRHLGNRLKQWLMYLKRHYHEAVGLFEDIKTLRDQAALEAAFAAHRARIHQAEERP